MNVIQKWPIYRFELTYCRQSLIGTCLIEIMALGPDPERPTNPVVVITQRRTDTSALGIRPATQEICTLVRVGFLTQLGIDPAEVTWIQHWEEGFSGKPEWSRVTFEGDRVPKELVGLQGWWRRVMDAITGAGVTEGKVAVLQDYKNPCWHCTAPVNFDWGAIPEGSYTVTERQVVDMAALDLEPFNFTRDECCERATGTCSLDPAAIPDSIIDENGYSYCRRLAVLAQLWNLLLEYFQGEAPLQNWEAVVTADVLQYVLTHWDDRYGFPSDDLPLDIRHALVLFGAVKWSDAIVAYLKNGKVSFGDGRHRTCVASRLNIPVGAFMTREKQRSDQDAT